MPGTPGWEALGPGTPRVDAPGSGGPRRDPLREDRHLPGSVHRASRSASGAGLVSERERPTADGSFQPIRGSVTPAG